MKDEFLLAFLPPAQAIQPILAQCILYHVTLLLKDVASLPLLIQYNPSSPIGLFLTSRAWPQIILVTFSLTLYPHGCFGARGPGPKS